MEYFSRVLFLLAFCCSVNAKLPEFIKVCPRSSTDINKCIINSIHDLLPFVSDGIPTLNVPALEPLPLPQLNLNRGPNGANIRAIFNDIKVRGATKDFTIDELKADPENDLFEFKVTIPKVSFEGKYKLRMNVLLLVVKGEGDVNGYFSGLHLRSSMQGKRVQINGVEHMQFEKLVIKMKVDGGHINLTNLFNGDRTLGEAANQALNENNKAFIDEFIPSLEDALSDIFTDVANSILKTASYNEIFPK